MSNQLILVADSDPKNLMILKENLEASGFSVITASDGLRAWEEIQANTPHLVLTEITLPELNGFQLLEKIQTDPNTSFIPLIFLTNQRDVQQRVRGFQSGAKDYLVKPLHVKEVIAHIRMVSRRSAKRHIDRSKNYLKITGQLSEMNLADLIEKFSVERKSGVLSLNNGNEKSGKVYFRDGNVINASCSTMNLEKAVYQMLPWDRGFFNMVFKNVDDVPDAISISNFGLLLEGAKRMDKTEDYIKKFSSLKTIFTLSTTFKTIIGKKKLPKDVSHFISLIDGEKSIEQIIEESNYDNLKTMERLHRLYEQNFIEAVKTEKPAIVPEKVLPAQEQIPQPHPPEEADVEREEVIEEEPSVISKPVETIHIPPIPKSIYAMEAEMREEDKKETENTEETEETKEIKLAEPEQIRVAPVGKKPRQVKEQKPDEPVVEEELPEIPKTPVETEKPEVVQEMPKTVKIEKIPKEPLFNKEAFIKKQVREPAKSHWTTVTSSKDPFDENGSSNKFEVSKDKDQLLIIGLDEDILDEAMDLMTKNNFQTKKIQAVEGIPIHFGRIAEKRYEGIKLFGLFPEKSFSKFVAAQKNKLIGNIFIIDCSTEAACEYARYLVHHVRDSFKLPFMVAVANLPANSGTSLDVIRHKLHLDQNIPVLTWDGDNTESSVKRLLSHIELDVKNVEKSGKMDTIVEKISA